MRPQTNPTNTSLSRPETGAEIPDSIRPAEVNPPSGAGSGAGPRWRDWRNRLLGAPDEVPLELRFLHGICLIACVTTATMVLVNLVMVTVNWLDVILAGAAFSVSGAVYWASRFRALGPSVRSPFAVLMLTLASASWFSNEGLEGSAPAVYFMVLIGGIMVLPPRRRAVWNWVAIGWAVVLVLIHRISPEWLVRYPTPDHRLLDVAIYLLLCLAGVSVFIVTLHREYEHERRRREHLHDLARAESQTLAAALEKIHVLEGLLPVCSQCKCIQQPDGRWLEIEQYLADRSEVLFSHGICSHCCVEFYGEFFEPGETEGAAR